jgi:hypothetical protein
LKHDVLTGEWFLLKAFFLTLICSVARATARRAEGGIKKTTKAPDFFPRKLPLPIHQQKYKERSQRARGFSQKPQKGSNMTPFLKRA